MIIKRMFARLSAFVIWSLVAASAVFWLLRFAARPAPVPPYAVAVGTAVAVRGDLTRLFGAPPRAVAQAAPEAPSRYKLVGVMAPKAGAAKPEARYGLALIAVDGKPAKAYPVGARLDSDLVLQSVGLRTASLGPAQGERSVLLELPALVAPASGVLPPVAGATPVPPALPPRPVVPMPATQSLGVAQPPMIQAPPPTQVAPPATSLPTPGGLPTQ
jgi:general secretion pathway protein C